MLKEGNKRKSDKKQTLSYRKREKFEWRVFVLKFLLSLTIDVNFNLVAIMSCAVYELMRFL